METSVASLRSRTFVAVAASGSRSAPRAAARAVPPLCICRERRERRRRCSRRRRQPAAFDVAAAAASGDDLFSALEPPDVDGDVSSAYADAGARFDVRV